MAAMKEDMLVQELSLADRLVSPWDHLGLKTAHLAAQMPSDLDGFAARAARGTGCVRSCHTAEPIE